ncbi:MAG TPA: ABC transporter permease [Gemmataceae bacterium]|nr:ABC transporter permease [Gemmataceae bacterium]
MLNQLPVAPWLLVPLVSAAVLLVVLLLIGKVPLAYNIQNLLVRWRTTLLTALAFTLVVSLLTVMLAFVNGMARLTEGSGHPENVIVLSDGATDESFSNMTYSDTADVERIAGVLSDPQGRPLCSKEVYIIATQQLPAVSGQAPRQRFVQVRGIEDPLIAGRVHGMDLFPGSQWFSEAGVEQLPPTEASKDPQTAIQAVIGEGVARELGRDLKKERLEVGDVFELGPRKWIVSGIMQSSGSTFGSEIWAKGSYVSQLYGKFVVSSLVLRTANAASARAVADDVNTKFKKSALQAQVETEYYSKLSATNKQFLGAIIFVTIIMAIGGIFGVMNTMFAAISQRKKDVGVLRILGYARWQVLVSFFLESLVIALVGGMLGCALGSLTNGWTATSLVSGGQGGFGKTVVLKLVVDANTLAAGMVVTLFMGALGGLVPALTAMRLRPLESLK